MRNLLSSPDFRKSDILVDLTYQNEAQSDCQGYCIKRGLRKKRYILLSNAKRDDKNGK
jgi:hypothetical protein